MDNDDGLDGGLFGNVFGQASAFSDYHGTGSSKGRGNDALPWRLEERQSSNLVGLLNQGATCYLNSLIQALFMTPEFRSGIYDLIPDEVAEVASQEEEVDAGLKTQLESMGFESSMVIKALKRFPLPDQEVQRIEWILSGADDLGEIEKKTKKKVRKLGKIPRALQKLFALLQEANIRAVSTEELTRSFKWEKNEAMQQHDVHELNRVLFDAIEKSLKNTSGKDLIKNLYGGTQTYKTTCSECGNVSERSETIQDLTVHLGGNKDLFDALQSLTSPEPLDGSNQYFCDKCNKKVNASRSVQFRALPDVLIVCISRFEYDFKNNSRVKNRKKFGFPFELDMAPFGEDKLKPGDLFDLSGVVIHVGKGASFGHYRAYIKDRSVKDSDHWFEFDDSRVSPISKEKVESQFGGDSNECAYMLVYNRRKSSPPILSSIPEVVKMDVTEYNQSLAKDRQCHLEAKYKFSVEVFSEKDLEVSGDGRLLKKQKSPKVSQVHGEAGDDDIMDLFAEKKPIITDDGPLTVRVDCRQTVMSFSEELKALFAEGTPH